MGGGQCSSQVCKPVWVAGYGWGGYGIEKECKKEPKPQTRAAFVLLFGVSASCRWQWPKLVGRYIVLLVPWVQSAVNRIKSTILASAPCTPARQCHPRLRWQLVSSQVMTSAIAASPSFALAAAVAAGVVTVFRVCGVHSCSCSRHRRSCWQLQLQLVSSPSSASVVWFRHRLPCLWCLQLQLQPSSSFALAAGVGYP